MTATLATVPKDKQRNVIRFLILENISDSEIQAIMCMAQNVITKSIGNQWVQRFIVTTVVTISVIPCRYKSTVTIVGNTVAPNIVDSGSYCRHDSCCDCIQSCTIVAGTMAYNHVKL